MLGQLLGDFQMEYGDGAIPTLVIPLYIWIQTVVGDLKVWY